MRLLRGCLEKGCWRQEGKQLRGSKGYILLNVKPLTAIYSSYFVTNKHRLTKMNTLLHNDNTTPNRETVKVIAQVRVLNNCFQTIGNHAYLPATLNSYHNNETFISILSAYL
jgi:hypothetical protein